jgi:hypothetical protein
VLGNEERERSQVQRRRELQALRIESLKREEKPSDRLSNLDNLAEPGTAVLRTYEVSLFFDDDSAGV